MAITTNNGKQSMMEWDLPWEPNIPMDSTSFATTLQKQMLILGQAVVTYAAAGGGFITSIFSQEGVHSRIFGGLIIR